jgi:putative FmdB family regulatory protein
MPLFEYRCEKCDAVSEFLVGVSQEKQVIQCPQCGATELTKLLSATNVGGSHRKDKGTMPCCGSGGGCDISSCGGGSCPLG